MLITSLAYIRKEDSGKKFDTMANVSIFFVVIEIEKFKVEKCAFSFDIYPLLDQTTCGYNYHTCGNNYDGNICMVIITTGTLI